MADEMFLPLPLQSVVVESLAGGGGSGRKAKKDPERIPQWGFDETRELIAIRAELEKDFTQTKRNKTLWELISGKMKDRGYRRSADQCKCKWKNLVNRYKGKELSDPENGRQCPFFDELDAIFKARLENAGSKLLLESDGLIRPKKRPKQQQQHLSDDPDNSDEEEEEEDDPSGGEDDQRAVQKKKRKADKERQRATAEKYRANNMQEVLEEFFQQQQRMEEQWREVFERRDRERREREAEWNARMERLEQERRLREQEWWEREEVRRAQEELRSQKRDELLTALVIRVAQGGGGGGAAGIT